MERISWIDMVGWAASAAVLATFCMNTMMPLRVLAIISNVLFCAFGAVAHIFPVLILHAILLPVNIVRLVQIRRLVHGVQAAENSELSVQSLLPFMSRRKLKAGDILVRKGDKADSMFYLMRGNLEIQEIGKVLGSGTLVGEIGVFARNQTRMATVVCSTDCEVYELSGTKAKELYFQNPSFGYAVLQIITGRLLENMNVPADTTQIAGPATSATTVHAQSVSP
jgi:CRP/FNR family cyclic AMP-dependent transcriptional regulator